MADIKKIQIGNDELDFTKKQDKIDSSHKLSADLVDDSSTTHKFTTSSDISKLAGIESGAEVNVQSDWNQTTDTADDYIKNKPSLATVATSGSYNDLSNKPTIPTVNNATLTIQKNGTTVKTFTANASSDVTANITVPTKTSDLTNDGSDGTSAYVEADDLATVATSGSYSDLSNKPSIGNATITIQKNGTSAGTFTTNATSNKSINITVPTTASDVSALPDSTKYGASILLTIDDEYKAVINPTGNPKSQGWFERSGISPNYVYTLTNDTSVVSGKTYYTAPTWVITQTLKDQDGNALGSSQSIDLPLESVVVSGRYDSQTKEVILTLEDGSEIKFSVADLVSGLQTEITSSNKLSSDLVDDTDNAHKFMTSSEKTKLSGIETGAEVNVQADWTQTTTTADDYIKNKPSLATVATSGSYNDLSNKPTIPTVNNATLTITQNGTSVGTFTANASTNKTIEVTDTTYSDATTSASGLMSSTDKTKLNGIATGAEVNQNAFSNVKVGSTTVAADSKTDTLELVAGSNVTLTPDATNDKVTIAATDTTYSDATTSTSGLMSSTDKTKLNGIATGAEVNVQSDWNITDNTSDAFIKNKPTIPTVNNATLTITQNGTSAGTFTANASSNKTIALTDTTYSAGTNIDITSNTIKTKTLGVEYIVGTQTEDTNVWTGVSTDTGCSSSTIYTGKVIIYHLPYAGTKTAATLNLTLPDGTTTGAKNVRANASTNVTTHYSAGCDIFLVFDGTYWKAAPWYDSNNYDRIRHNTNVKAESAVTAGQIIVGTDAGYKPAANGITFSINYPILYAGSAITAAATGNNNYDAYPGVNLQSTKSGYTGTTYKMVFLVGTLSGTTFTVNSDIFTQTVPSSADGKVYAPIGLMTDSNKKVFFFPTITYWEYRNGAFRPISSCPTLATVATSGSYNDLSNKPTIPAAQVNSDWNSSSGVSQILNKPSLATVATSGSYDDLSNKPTIPTVNNATLTIQKNGTTVKTFTANASSNVTANITVPTNNNELTNGAGYITSSGSITGNAATATKLAAGKTIALGTGATGTATSFDGSANITIPVTSVKEAYLEWGDKALSGGVSPVDAALDPTIGTNKWAFSKAASFVFEYSTDGGSTWTNYGSTDAEKRAVTSTAGGTTLTLGKGSTTNYANNKLRLTFNSNAAGGDVYTSLRKILIYLSTNGATGTTVTVTYRTIGNYNNSSDTWGTLGTYNVSGWSGWNSIPYNVAFGGSTTQTSQIAQIRLTFNQTGGTNNMSVFIVHFVGVTNWSVPSNMGKTGHLYSYDVDQNATFPANVKIDGTQLQHGSYGYTLPSKSGTIAMTSDLPTVNNATLTIQKNGSNVQTFTANASSNVTANITVPTKTSDLTNNGADNTSTYIETDDAQKFAIQESMAAPDFDGMTPLQTFTWSVSDTTYRPVYQMNNTGWTYDNMDVAVAYRITVTGTNISQVVDIYERWYGPTNYPVTSAMCRTLSTSAATTGFRYLRAIYPTSSGLNNNTYKIGSEIANYNATARTIKVEVFKTATGVTWNTTKPSGPIYTDSTYQSNNSISTYSTRGWVFRKAASFQATGADVASFVNSYEPWSMSSSTLKAGAALTNGYLGYLATDGKVYMVTNTTQNMVPTDAGKIGLITTGYNANDTIDYRYFRPLAAMSSTQVGYISHDTFTLGYPVYLRCTMDSSGNIHSGNYLTTSMAAGYTYVPIGVATATNTVALDARKPMFYTIDSNGKLSHVNGKAVAGTTYTAGAHINITGSTIKAVDYVHSESPVSTSAVTPIITNDMISNGTIEFSKTKAGDFVQLTMSTTDISVGSALAKGTLYGVYSA